MSITSIIPVAGGDRAERVAGAAAADGQPVGGGVRVTRVDRLDPHLRARGLERRGRLGQPRIGGIPAEQAAEEPHVGALRFVRGRQRASPVELHEQLRGRAGRSAARRRSANSKARASPDRSRR
jgi:hypothetical protein